MPGHLEIAQGKTKQLRQLGGLTRSPTPPAPRPASPLRNTHMPTTSHSGAAHTRTACLSQLGKLSFSDKLTCHKTQSQPAARPRRPGAVRGVFSSRFQNSNTWVLRELAAMLARGARAGAAQCGRCGARPRSAMRAAAR